MVGRHEVLRATFPDVAGTPVVRLSTAGAWEIPRFDLQTRAPAERLLEGESLVLAEGRRPFDLTRGPVVRAALVSLSETEHLVLLTFHHIVFDAWSAGLVLEELSACYRSTVLGATPVLEELPIQYVDFAAWQRSRLDASSRARDLGYWRAQLQGLAPLLDLCADRARPARASFHGGRQPISISPSSTEALRALGRAEGATLFMVLLGAYQVLLSRWSGDTDIAVVCTIANRPLPVLERLLGIFFNLLVFRADLSGGPSFRELLGRVRQLTLEAYEHQELPFEELVAALNPDRGPGHRPFSQVSFTLHNVPVAGVTVAGAAFAPAPAHNGTAQFDLNLILDEGPAGLTGWLEYSTDLFDAETIARMATHLQRLLAAVVLDGARPISELPLLSAEERQTLLVTWNDTGAGLDDDRCIHEMFEEQARRTPEATAVVCEEQALSYRELSERANRLAHHLRSLGVGPEVLVGLCVERSVEMVVAVLGILGSGGAYVPLDPAHPRERLAFMAADAAFPVLVTQTRWAPGLPAHHAKVVWLDADAEAIAACSSAPPVRLASPTSPSYCLYTSGSTGRPKGVVIEHRGPTALIRWAKTVFSPADAGGVLFSTSLSFDLSVFELFLPLTSGGTVLVVQDALALLGLPGADRVTLINTVPSAIAELAARRAIPPSAKVVCLAGEPLTAALVEQVCGQPGVERVYNLYGPTEDSTYSTFARVSAGEPVTIGRPIAGGRAYVLDEHRQPVPVGVAGEIYLGGAGLARGYLNRPELTAERFVVDPFAEAPGERIYRTGDRGRHRSSGDLEFLGRLDHQVKIRGHRIELGEIESALSSHPSVRSCVVVALPPASPARDVGPSPQRLVAYVVLGEETLVSALREHLSVTLPDYMVPSSFVLLDVLPLTPNGKIHRKALPRPEGLSSGERGYVAPRAPTEELLAAIWAELLGLDVDRVGLDDDFFALGGHSLLGMRMIARLGPVFGVEPPLRTLFEARTVARFSARLDAARAQGFPLLAPPIARTARDASLP
ncbi:MAG: amino acid adenylation domain-containing protein, partial [Minicystis sp.]